MGGKVCKKNVLFIGPEGSRKTSLLYHLKLGQFIPDFRATDAFNYEIISRPRDEFRYDLHTWDLSGREELAQLWSVFYENANVDAVIYVINANQTESLVKMESDIHYLIHEETLRMTKFVVILNIFKEADPKRLTEDIVRKKLCPDVGPNATIPAARLSILEVNARTGDGLTRYMNELCMLDFGIQEPPQRI